MNAALIVVAVIALVVIVLLFASVKIAREYQRGVIFRLGRLLPEPKGPGLFLLIPFVDRMEMVELRTVTLNVPPQEVITKDNVPVRVNAVAYFRIVEPKVVADHSQEVARVVGPSRHAEIDLSDRAVTVSAEEGLQAALSDRR